MKIIGIFLIQALLLIPTAFAENKATWQVNLTTAVTSDCESQVGETHLGKRNVVVSQDGNLIKLVDRKLNNGKMFGEIRNRTITASTWYSGSDAELFLRTGAYYKFSIKTDSRKADVNMKLFYYQTNSTGNQIFDNNNCEYIGTAVKQ